MGLYMGLIITTSMPPSVVLSGTRANVPGLLIPPPPLVFYFNPDHGSFIQYPM